MPDWTRQAACSGEIISPDIALTPCQRGILQKKSITRTRAASETMFGELPLIWKQLQNNRPALAECLPHEEQADRSHSECECESVCKALDSNRIFASAALHQTDLRHDESSDYR